MIKKISFILLNIFLVPFGVIAGVFSLDSPSSSIMNFFITFIFVIGIPNIFFIFIIKLLNKLLDWYVEKIAS